MPRNGSGQYTLPSGGGVVSAGTTIESAWANALTADLATEIQNSLDRAGRGPMTAALKLFAGTIGAPGLAFDDEPGLGIYRGASGQLVFAAGGAAMASMQAGIVAARAAAGLSSYLSACGNGSSPGVGSFDLQQAADNSADVVQRANARMSFYTNSAERMRINADGKVGVGRTADTFTLEVEPYMAAVEGTCYMFLSAGDGSYGAIGTRANHPVFLYQNDTQRHVLDSAGHFYPAVTNTYNLGYATNRYGNIFSVLGNFSGTVTAAAFSGPLSGNVTGALTGNATTATSVSGTTSNGYGTRTINSGTPTGGSNGDIWYQV